MAEFPSIKDLVNKALDLELGSPILTVASKEEATKNYSMELGLQDYWRCCPYICRTSYPLSGAAGTTFVASFDSILNLLPNDENIKNSAYILGIVRTDIAVGAFNQGLYSFDQYLLGFNLRQRTLDPLKQVLAATINDLVTGQPKYQIDRIGKQVKFVLPVTIGQLIVDYGIGFYNWDYVEQSHVDLLAKMCAKRLLSSVIISRSSATVTADYSIPTSALESRLSKIESELDNIKSRYTKAPLIWD